MPNLQRSMKRFLYKLGIRPKAGSIWYSPSLHLRYVALNYAKRNITAMEETRPLVEANRLLQIEQLKKEKR